MNFVTVFETETDVLKAMPVSAGVLIKSITRYDGGQSESIYFLPGGALVNHGTEEEPIWKLNR